MNELLADEVRIRDLSERWVVSRDAADWDTFKTVWHPDGTIDTLWYQGSWEGYMAQSRAGWGRGMASVHFLCGSQIDVAGTRGLCRSNMTVYGRGLLEGVEYDFEAIAQFCDLLEKRADRWGLVYRSVVHFKDRMDATVAGTTLAIDAELLARQPAHYRHLAYLHTKAGRVIKTDMPGLDGASADRLRAKCKTWLGGP